MKKKELSIEQKKADKDLNIIIYATLIPLIIYLIFGNDIMNFAKTSEMNIWLRFIPVMLVQFSLAGFDNILFDNRSISYVYRSKRRIKRIWISKKQLF